MILAVLSQAMIDRLAILPPAEPFVIPQAGIVTVNVVAARTPR